MRPNKRCPLAAPWHHESPRLKRERETDSDEGMS